MKQKLLYSSFLIYSFCFSQDTIYLADGNKVIVKVEEVTPSEIKYKRFEMPDGPQYTESNNNVDKIVYKGGSIDIPEHSEVVSNVNVHPKDPKVPIVPNGHFLLEGKRCFYNNGAKPIGEKRMYQIMAAQNDPELNAITKKCKRSKHFRYWSFAAIPLGVGALEGIAMSISSDWREPLLYGMSTVMGVATIGCLTIGATAKHKQMEYTKKAVKLYNQKY